jgi:hypothetical protein
MDTRLIALTEITRVAFAAATRALPGGKAAKGNRKMEIEQNKSVTTHSAEVENICNAAEENAGFDKLLKFKKGDYFIGEEKIQLDTEFLAHVAAWTKCWIKFADGEITERKLYRVALGERPPEREDLDDLDQDK